MNWRSFATGLIVGMVVGAFGFYGFAQWEAARHEAAVAAFLNEMVGDKLLPIPVLPGPQ